MNLRLRSKWRTGDGAASTPVSIEDSAVALATVVWRVALGATKNLHTEKFDYDDDTQRVGVIREYLVFLAHLADRIAYTRLAEGERERFVPALVGELARHLQENQSAIMGAGDYRASFIDLLNARTDEYAETRFDGDDPGYQTYNCLGHHVLTVMGESQTNRWVLDHVVTLDGPEAVEHVQKAMANLLDSARARG